MTVILFKISQSVPPAVGWCIK